MRCPHCGGLNPATAEWCAQCYTRLEAPEAEATPQPGPEHEPQPEPAHVAGEGAGAAGRVFRTVDGEVQWRCDRCETWNTLGASRCVVCDTPFRDVVAVEPPVAAHDAPSEQRIVAATIALPGLGHVLAGRAGTGVARMVLFLVWFAGGVALVREAALTGAPAVAAVPLLGGALLLWGASIHDAYRVIRQDGRELLGARLLLWLVVGVLVAFAVALTAGVLGIIGRSAS